MKQEITQKQFMELNKVQADRVIGWLINKGCFYNTGEVHLTIGRMIEFLDENYSNEKLKQFCLNFKTIRGKKTYWYVGNHSGGILDKELCDALWQTVKEVLEK